jgi:phytoene/squalene synthetase
MVGLLRATRFLASRGRVLLPSHTLDEAGTSVAAVKELRANPGLARAAKNVALAAEAELDTVRTPSLRVPKNARAALLLAPLTDAYLARLRAARFDVLNGDLSLSPLRKQLAVGWAAMLAKV